MQMQNNGRYMVNKNERKSLLNAKPSPGVAASPHWAPKLDPSDPESTPGGRFL